LLNKRDDDDNLYLNSNSSHATAHSEPLPVDLHKVTICTGRGHIVAVPQAAQLGKTAQ